VIEESEFGVETAAEDPARRRGSGSARSESRKNARHELTSGYLRRAALSRWSFLCYADAMDRDAIRMFVERPWHLVDLEKIRARAERYRVGRAAACVGAARELRDTWQRRHAADADPQRREADIQSHVRLARKLAAISDALPRR